MIHNIQIISKAKLSTDTRKVQMVRQVGTAVAHAAEQVSA